MRKVLSFVLVLSLVLGSFSMAFAATPADVAGTPNEEAVEVLMGLGVVNGYPDGSFKPENIVTRAEMAKMIVVALGLQDYATGTSKFPDMAGATWAQGYVNYAAGLGIIKGYPDGTFKPSATVSYDEATAMVVRALGYTDASLLPATWPSNYVVKAKALGVLDGIKASALGANRGDIAKILYNALTAEIGTVDADNKWNPNDTTALGTNPDNFLVRLGAEITPNTVVDGTEETLINLVKYVGVYGDIYTIDDEVVAVDPASTNLHGEYVDANGTFTAITASGIFEDTDKDYTVSADVADVTIPKFINGVYSTDITLDAVSSATTYDLAADVSGKRVDDVYSVSTWFIEAAELFTADDADRIAEDQELYGYDFILDDNDEIDYNQFLLQGAATLEDIKADDVVYVSARSGEIKRIQVGTEVITGKVTEVDGDDYTIGGKVYNISEESTATLTIGDTVTARLDYNGDIFDVDVDDSTPDTYAIVKAYSGALGVDGARVKLYTSEDATTTFDVDEDVATTLTTGALIGYGLDKDGVIDGLDLTAITRTAATLASISVLNTNNGSYPVAKDAAVFTLDGTTYDVTTIDKVKTGVNLAAPTVQLIIDGDGYVVALVVDAAAAGVTDDDTYALVNTVVFALDADDERIQKLSGFAAGTAITKFTDDDNTLDGKYTDTAVTLLNLELDTDGIVIDATVKNADAGSGAATIAAINSDKTAVQVSGVWEPLAANVIVYEAEDDDGYEYKTSSKSSLRDGYKISLYDTDTDEDGYEIVIFER